MPTEIEEHRDIAARFEPVIAAIEAALATGEDGSLAITGDAESLGVDPEIFAQLNASLTEANGQIANGAIALGDLSLNTPGEANA